MIPESRLCRLGAPPIGRAIGALGYRKNPDRRVRRLFGYCLGKRVMGAMATSASNVSEKLQQARAAVDKDYVPSDDEEYMGEKQLDYFRMLLLDWKKSIHDAAGQTLQSLQDGPIREPDLNDRASSETDWGIELRTRDRQRKLISKIDAALRRIDQGEYGWCEVTGDPIGLRRLIARPVATMTVEAQEAHERREKISRDD